MPARHPVCNRPIRNTVTNLNIPLNKSRLNQAAPQHTSKSCQRPLRLHKALGMVLVYALSTPLTASLATAEPTQNNVNQEVVDPQVAPSPNTPFNNVADNDTTTADEDNPDALADPNSLASQMHPSNMDLSAANQKLLSQNAQLKRDINALETRVNVLTNEHSGQLFMYGAVTVAIALFTGFGLGWFVFGRRELW